MSRKKVGQSEVDKVLGAISTGLPIGAACALVGISVATLSARRKADPALNAAVLAAVDKAEGQMVKHVARAAKSQWQAAAFWLERRRPGRWSKRERLDVSQTVTLEWSSPVRSAIVDVTSDVKTLPSPAPEGGSMRLDATLPRDPESDASVTRPPPEGSQGERRAQ